MAKIIGIDLGTSNSAAAVIEGGKPSVIPSAEGTSLGGKAFPSYVAFTSKGELLVGEPARRQAITNPEGTIIANKRKMGTNHRYRIYGKEYTPEQISAYILQKIKRDAEAFLGDKVEKAVITVPAYFDDHQRQATKDAGKIAGLDVIRIINEPTAASLAFGLDKSTKEQKILVFDLGGGTLDVTIMDFGQGVFEVISTSGDTQLGGTDMDNALINYICDDFKKSTNIDLRKDKMAIQRVREAAEKAKIELSNVLETEINLPFISATNEGPQHLALKLLRSKLEELVTPIVERCTGPVDNAIRDSKLTPDQIDRIVMVGGPTRMPIIQKFLEEHIGKKLERGIDPMESVCIGAGIQAAILQGDIKDVLLLDVTPLSLGIETLGGVFTKLIERNTTIPTRKSQIFSTATDNQPAVSIHVLQGEREMAQYNKTLGKFDLVGIPPAPRGMPQIEVTFDIDANGIVHVSAKDLGTGKEQKIRIESTSGLPKDEIEKMVKEAEVHAAEDKKRKEEVEIRNQADTLMYTVQKSVKDYGDKLGAEEKTKIEDSIAQLKKALEGSDIDAVKKAMEELNTASHKLSEMLYQEAAQKHGHTGNEQANAAKEQSNTKDTKEGQKDENVQDADFEVVDDEKK
ncbi:MAG: molecular chaperone DnaK [Candidatus Firestonebacteria bacterium]|nr:molecular chaperone DnaK [Candidatus Firestonebacteria bacterium]